MSVEGQPKTTQELLKYLKKKQARISKKLINFPLDGDPKKFASLQIKAGDLGQQIETLLDSIPSAGNTGELGQYTLESTQSPEDQMTTKKKK
jgi:hypothetical protein